MARPPFEPDQRAGGIAACIQMRDAIGAAAGHQHMRHARRGAADAADRAAGPPQLQRLPAGGEGDAVDHAIVGFQVDAAVAGAHADDVADDRAGIAAFHHHHVHILVTRTFGDRALGPAPFDHDAAAAVDRHVLAPAADADHGFDAVARRRGRRPGPVPHDQPVDPPADQDQPVPLARRTRIDRSQPFEAQVRVAFRIAAEQRPARVEQHIGQGGIRDGIGPLGLVQQPAALHMPSGGMAARPQHRRLDAGRHRTDAVRCGRRGRRGRRGGHRPAPARAAGKRDRRRRQYQRPTGQPIAHARSRSQPARNRAISAASVASGWIRSPLRLRAIGGWPRA